jgi:hypothetical protein
LSPHKQDAGIKTADTVVLTGLADENLPSVEADAIVLSSILQVMNEYSDLDENQPHEDRMCDVLVY